MDPAKHVPLGQARRLGKGCMFTTEGGDGLHVHGRLPRAMERFPRAQEANCQPATNRRRQRKKKKKARGSALIRIFFLGPPRRGLGWQIRRVSQDAGDAMIPNIWSPKLRRSHISSGRPAEKYRPAAPVRARVTRETGPPGPLVPQGTSPWLQGMELRLTTLGGGGPTAAVKTARARPITMAQLFIHIARLIPEAQSRGEPTLLHSALRLRNGGQRG